MLGFIGLGVMGAPMCRNLAAKSGQEVRAFDSDLDTLAQMDQSGVTPAESVRDVAEHADIVFLSLPGGHEVHAVCLGAGSLLTHLKPGGLVVDLSTTPVKLARDLSARFSARGIQFAGLPGEGILNTAEESAADRPGPGVWWYRVAITPYYRTDRWTPTPAVGQSPPVRVVVGG